MSHTKQHIMECEFCATSAMESPCANCRIELFESLASLDRGIELLRNNPGKQQQLKAVIPQSIFNLLEEYGFKDLDEHFIISKPLVTH